MKISSSTPGSTSKRSPAEADEAPSDELLEFLGEWSGADGEWTDPLDLEALGENERRADEDEHD